MSLGSRINEIRKERKMGLDELCERSGVPKGTLSKITAGITTNPTLDTIQSIARALGCKLDDFDDKPEIKNTSVLEEDSPETEALAIRLYSALIAYGLLKPGEDLTEQQLKALDAVCVILESLFDHAD